MVLKINFYLFTFLVPILHVPLLSNTLIHKGPTIIIHPPSCLTSSFLFLSFPFSLNKKRRNDNAHPIKSFHHLPFFFVLDNSKKNKKNTTPIQNPYTPLTFFTHLTTTIGGLQGIIERKTTPFFNLGTENYTPFFHSQKKGNTRIIFYFFLLTDRLRQYTHHFLFLRVRHTKQRRDSIFLLSLYTHTPSLSSIFRGIHTYLTIFIPTIHNRQQYSITYSLPLTTEIDHLPHSKHHTQKT